MNKRIFLVIFIFFIRVAPELVEIIIKTIESVLVHIPFINSLKYTWVLLVRQRWQFYIEKSFFDKGKGRVEDPLFVCKFETKPSGKDMSLNKSPGSFYLMFDYSGLIISGTLNRNKRKNGEGIIEIFLDDTIIKTIHINDGLFKMRFFRSTIDLLPKSVDISIRLKDSDYLLYKHSPKVNLKIPHGNSTIFDKLNQGFSLSKKGTFSLSGKDIGERQKNYIQAYLKLRSIFERDFNKSLFLMYGTLLGLYRDDNFIPGDDDFDCCYVSLEVDPVRVKEETKRIVIELINSGLTVSFNRKGRLFRVPVGSNSEGAYIDICPVWFKDGCLWTHPLTKIPAQIHDFLPVKNVKFKGEEVYIPNLPEVFLAGYYGAGWKVPDPGYITDLSKLKRKDITFLKKAYITPKDYIEMLDVLLKNEKENQGRLISGSLHNLYPLEEFIF